MKKTIFYVLSCVLLSFSSFAQNDAGKADDADRISITPDVSDQEIPQGAKNMLINKMKQICSKNGMSGAGENPFFVMDASIDILSKDLTPTAPPMHALNLSVNFEIKDNINGNVYSQTSIEVKGVGKNETKAYIEAIKRIDTNSGQFKAFVEKGKTKILEFYNSECDLVIAKGQALHTQGENGEAIKVLKSVPPVCKECYAKCMELLSQIEPPVEEPKDSSTNPTADGASADQGGSNQGVGAEQEIDDNIFLVYKGHKIIGNELRLKFVFENRGANDYEVKDYVWDTRILDGGGVEHKVESTFLGDKETGAYISATVINGVTSPIEFRFVKVATVSMFEYKFKNNLFRFKDISLE